MKQLHHFLDSVVSSVRDLLPIALVVTFFQLIVIQQPVPELGRILTGSILVILGLAFFVRGLKQALFPVGRSIAFAFARKASLGWLLVFAFALGFSTTIAEPALTAIAGEAAKIAAEGRMIGPDDAAMRRYAFGLRLTVALSVGVAIAIGVFRIIRGWPVQYFIIGGYIGVLIMTTLAPPEIIGIAYDSGGITTSTVTVPLVAALGVGLAESIKGRNPMVDGFGLIALASLTPIIFVMAYGMII